MSLEHPSDDSSHIYILYRFRDSHLLHHIALLDSIHNIHAIDNLSENSMYAIKMWLWGVGYEELASTCILASVCHGQCTSFMLASVYFALNRITWPACTCTFWTATLNHKIGDDPVDFQTVVESLVYKCHKIIYSIGCIIHEQLNCNSSFVGLNNCFFHVLSLLYNCIILYLSLIHISEPTRLG